MHVGHAPAHVCPLPIEDQARSLVVSCGMTCSAGGSRQLGTVNSANVNIPTEVLGGTYSWLMISAGAFHTCGVTSINDVRCWVGGEAVCCSLLQLLSHAGVHCMMGVPGWPACWPSVGVAGRACSGAGALMQFA